MLVLKSSRSKYYFTLFMLLNTICYISWYTFYLLFLSLILFFSWYFYILRWFIILCPDFILFIFNLSPFFSWLSGYDFEKSLHDAYIRSCIDNCLPFYFFIFFMVSSHCLLFFFDNITPKKLIYDVRNKINRIISSFIKKQVVNSAYQIDRLIQ